KCPRFLTEQVLAYAPPSKDIDREMARILIIDDDPDMRSLLEQTLKSLSYEIETASNGKEGLMLYDANRPDVVITDLYMPTKGGLETIIELRRRSPQV